MQPPPDSLADTALLGAFLQEGDEAALVALVARLTPRLYRVARALTAWRVLGAQTVVEQAWRVVLGDADDLARADEGALEARLLAEVTRRALEAGDSPRRDADLEAAPERAAAMRAVTLLPRAERAVYALHDVGGATLETVADLLGRPAARVRAELWHARLAVATLVGGGLPVPDSEADSAGAPVAPEVWDEPLPTELVSRIMAAAGRRRMFLASRPGRRRGPVLGVVFALVLLGSGYAGMRLQHQAPLAASAAAPRWPAAVPVAPVVPVGHVPPPITAPADSVVPPHRGGSSTV